MWQAMWSRALARARLLKPPPSPSPLPDQGLANAIAVTRTWSSSCTPRRLLRAVVARHGAVHRLLAARPAPALVRTGPARVGGRARYVVGRGPAAGASSCAGRRGGGGGRSVWGCRVVVGESWRVRLGSWSSGFCRSVSPAAAGPASPSDAKPNVKSGATPPDE